MNKIISSKQKKKVEIKDIPVSQMQNYNKVKSNMKRIKKLLEQANKKRQI